MMFEDSIANVIQVVVRFIFTETLLFSFYSMSEVKTLVLKRMSECHCRIKSGFNQKEHFNYLQDDMALVPVESVPKAPRQAKAKAGATPSVPAKKVQTCGFCQAKSKDCWVRYDAVW